MLCPVCLKEVGFPQNEKDDTVVVVIINAANRHHYHKPCWTALLRKKVEDQSDYYLALRELWNGGQQC